MALLDSVMVQTCTGAVMLLVGGEPALKTWGEMSSCGALDHTQRVANVAVSPFVSQSRVSFAPARSLASTTGDVTCRLCRRCWRH